MSWYQRDVAWKPIEAWPGEYTERRQRSRFEAGLGDTQNLLDRELNQIGCNGQIIIEADLSHAQIRVDGHPRAKSKIPPPIKITIPTRKHGTLVYATDRFDHWADNLRAIALGLEALRKVERYGITDRGQQYKGFAALPAGSKAERPAEVIARVSGLPVDIVLMEPGAAVRQAQFRAHPDRGGSDELFHAVTVAAASITKGAA